MHLKNFRRYLTLQLLLSASVLYAGQEDPQRIPLTLQGVYPETLQVDNTGARAVVLSSPMGDDSMAQLSVVDLRTQQTHHRSFPADILPQRMLIVADHLYVTLLNYMGSDSDEPILARFALADLAEGGELPLDKQSIAVTQGPALKAHAAYALAESGGIFFFSLCSMEFNARGTLCYGTPALGAWHASTGEVGEVPMPQGHKNPIALLKIPASGAQAPERIAVLSEEGDAKPAQLTGFTHSNGQLSVDESLSYSVPADYAGRMTYDAAGGRIFVCDGGLESKGKLPVVQLFEKEKTRAIKTLEYGVKGSYCADLLAAGGKIWLADGNAGKIHIGTLKPAEKQNDKSELLWDERRFIRLAVGEIPTALAYATLRSEGGGGRESKLVVLVRGPRNQIALHVYTLDANGYPKAAKSQ